MRYSKVKLTRYILCSIALVVIAFAFIAFELPVLGAVIPTLGVGSLVVYGAITAVYAMTMLVAFFSAGREHQRYKIISGVNLQVRKIFSAGGDSIYVEKTRNGSQIEVSRNEIATRHFLTVTDAFDRTISLEVLPRSIILLDAPDKPIGVPLLDDILSALEAFNRSYSIDDLRPVLPAQEDETRRTEEFALASRRQREPIAV